MASVQSLVKIFDGQGYDTRLWGKNDEHLDDIPKAMIEHAAPKSPEHAIPGLLGISHLVPFVTDSYPEALEYLGRGATVSIRTPTGQMLRHRGDVHVRVFKQGVIPGWQSVASPSRTELDLLLKILQREGEYGKEMTRLLDKFDNVTPATGRVEKKEEAENDGDVEDEEMAESTEGEEDTVVISRAGANLRTPPNSPEMTVKIGPPGERRTRIPTRGEIYALQVDVYKGAAETERGNGRS